MLKVQSTLEGGGGGGGRGRGGVKDAECFSEVCNWVTKWALM